MVVDVHKLIAAISPETYCSGAPDDSGMPIKKRVRKILKDGKGYIEAAKVVKVVEQDFMEFDLDEVYYTGKGPMGEAGLKNPIEKHMITYDAASSALEPIYFWLLDYINERYIASDKLVDNFISSAGSAHFAEMGGRATRMQEEAMKMLGAVNQVIKSVLNIVYDLKEFKIRLEIYEKLENGTKDEKQSSILSLKQIWMDTVDMKRGNSSIKAMAQQFDYVTLIDAFMVADSLEAVTKKEEGSLDLNDRVRRILQQRVGEFFNWIKQSEQELRKRFEIEKSYLRSQVNTIQLYSRWVKPYLVAVKNLEQRADPTASLVNAFNTALFELVLLGEGGYDPLDEVITGELPRIFKRVKYRKYVPIVIVELKFRTIPERLGQQQGYAFRGKVDITFTSYALNVDELKVLKEEIRKDDLKGVMELVGGITEDSLKQMQKDIDEFLNPEKLKAEEKKEEETDNTGPFAALFSFWKTPEKKEEKKEDFSKGVSEDSSFEKVIRNQAILEARKNCRKFWEIYKKVNSMPTF